MNKRPSTYSSPRICDTCKHSTRTVSHSFNPERGTYLLCSFGDSYFRDIRTLPTVYQDGTCNQWASASKLKMEVLDEV